MGRLLFAFRKRFASFYLRKIQYNSNPKKISTRTRLYGYLFKSMGRGCKIKSGCIIEDPHMISIGSNVSIQHSCYLSGYGGITIGDDSSLGNNTRIFTTEHPYTKGIPFREQPLEICPVAIGRNVITGSGVIILGGVHIGDNVIIGAGSVVSRDVPSNCIFAGNPARKIKDIVLE